MLEDRYELVEQLGTGGMATVWKAQDRVLGRVVAIKRLLPHLASDPAIAERFQREARSAAVLSHPGIVTVFDTGEDEDGAFIVLELVEGDTLAQKLRTDGPLDLPTTAAIISQVADALDYAHGRGIVHRDIKPANLILDEEGVVQLADFGIARSVNEASTLTLPGEVLGTVAYMAPEVIRGEPVTAASDIYSLGAVAFEMLSGRPPFEAENVGALLAAVQNGDKSSLSGIVPDPVAAAVEKAMDTDPENRFAGAGAFAGSLMAGTTIVLPPDALVIDQAAPQVTSSSPETPTLVMTPEAPPEDVPNKRRSPVLLGALLLVLLIAVAAAMSVGDPIVDSTSTTTSTAGESSTTSEATSTTSTTSTTQPDTPEGVATEIQTHLSELDQPTFKPKDVKRVEDRLDDLMKEWAEEDREKLEERVEKLYEAIADLPDSPEREHLFEHLDNLAEMMGVSVEFDRDED